MSAVLFQIEYYKKNRMMLISDEKIKCEILSRKIKIDKNNNNDLI